MRVKTKNTIKQILSVSLVVIVILGVLGACISIFGNEKKDISVTEFSIGGLNEAGEYTDRKDSIYTKNLIECKGLEIERDFDSNVTYKVFFYNKDKEFVESTASLSGSYKLENDTVRYCRIMIVVPIPEDVSDDEFEIGFFDVWGYADDLKISVDKNQKYELVDFFDVCMRTDGFYVKNKTSTNVFESFVENDGMSCVGWIDVSEYASLNFIFDDVDEHDVQVLFFTADGEYLCTSTLYAQENYNVIVEVPEDAGNIYVNFKTGETMVINEYERR